MDELARIVPLTYADFCGLRKGDPLLFIPEYWIKVPSAYADHCRNQYVTCVFVAFDACFPSAGPKAIAHVDIDADEEHYLRRGGSPRSERAWYDLFRRTR